MPAFLCRSLRLTGVVVCALLCAGVTAGAQDVPKEKQTALLLSATEMYYNLRLAGAESYTCRVEFDWDGFFSAVAGSHWHRTIPR